MRKLEANPARAQALAKARGRIGKALLEVDGEHEHTLAALRLRAGLSQAKLAKLMGTQQPNIARWERDPTGLLATSAVKLAKALSVNPMEILTLVEEKAEQAMRHGR